MTPERWQKIEQLYHAAFERDASLRPEYLQKACAGDDALRSDQVRTAKWRGVTPTADLAAMIHLAENGSA
ncbi:MAG TPA: hypothetical protein VGR89_12825 [Puia sp.]|nr:hypothetical protein [Puia sp.]